jgi:hypothetical protein
MLSIFRLAGPDFFNAQITRIKNGLEMSKFILNLQIGMCIITKEREAYENVILHVVWEHDRKF